MIILKNWPENFHYKTTPSKVIAEVAKTCNVDQNTVKPINFKDVSAKIGEDPALLMLSMLSNPNCSKVGLETVLKIIQAIAGTEKVWVAELDFMAPFTRPLNFVLMTDGFLKDDFENYQNITGNFRFTPEAKYNQSEMRDGAKGVFSLDLQVSFFITVTIPKTPLAEGIFQSIEVASVVVEVDGPTHLQDEKVRLDKERDSMIQALGKTVFRIQTPYQQTGPGSQKANSDALETLVNNQIGDIKEHFRTRIFQQIQVSDLIHKALSHEKNTRKQLHLSNVQR